MNKEILKSLIEKTGLTQRAFGEKIGVDETRISHWLSGYRNIRNARLEEIAKTFGYIIKINYEILAQ